MSQSNADLTRSAQPAQPQNRETRRRLVTLAQAGKHAQVTERTIRNWIGNGYITGYRIGARQVVVDLDEVDRMLRTMPSTKVRSGRYAYGPKSRIVDLSSAVNAGSIVEGGEQE
ncbi:AlpA family transcriptional regulator [Terrabacter sp. Root85]|uniref:helix-turn-helix transcriptional regulator n=1 Tax=Terrabacter sp. Root85 TaxID=1736603 RepID=UPI000AF23BD0|nr:helix-turn-helix domain-containing protein [Terrabacter sp. Root85]